MEAVLSRGTGVTCGGGIRELSSSIMNIYNTMLSIFQAWALIRNLTMLCLLALLSSFSCLLNTRRDGSERATGERGL